MTDKAIFRLTRELLHHSETLQIIASQLEALSNEYAALAELVAQHKREAQINKPEHTPIPDVMRTAEAADYLGIPRQTLAVYRMKGGGPRYIRLGTSSRSPCGYRKADLDAWLEARSFESTSSETTSPDGDDPTD